MVNVWSISVMLTAKTAQFIAALIKQRENAFENGIASAMPFLFLLPGTPRKAVLQKVQVDFF